jgi:hypothetical protein
MDIPRFFRFYKSYSAGEYEGVTIWQAGRVILAAPIFFKRMHIGRPSFEEEFIDGGININNSIKIMIQKAFRIFRSNRSIICIISIGIGKANIIELGISEFLQRWVSTQLINVLKEMTTDSEEIAREMEEKFSNYAGFYFRFNVEHGL